MTSTPTPIHLPILPRTARALRGGLLRVAYFLSAAIMLPFALWVYLAERGSFSRIPVTAGILLLCVVTGLLYFATTVRFRLRFAWRKALLLAGLFAFLGLGFLGVMSVILFSYLCEAVSYWGLERRGRPRPAVSPNHGLALAVVLAVVVFPLLSDMYYRGTQVRVFFPDYNKQNIFYRINRDGFRGPRVPLEHGTRPRLLFLGDSSPFGWPYRYREAFPFLVQDILRDRGIEVEVINAATMGQSDGAMRHQMRWFLEYRPDLVFLMTGIHYLRAERDYQRILQEGASRKTGWRPTLALPPMLIELMVFSVATSPVFKKRKAARTGPVTQHPAELAAFKAHLRAMVQQVRDAGPHLYLVDYPTPLAERAVQDEIRRIGRETGTDYIPLFDLIGDDIKDHLYDDIHPDRVGHRMIAEQIARVAANALAPRTPRP